MQKSDIFSQKTSMDEYKNRQNTYKKVADDFLNQKTPEQMSDEELNSLIDQIDENYSEANQPVHEAKLRDRRSSLDDTLYPYTPEFDHDENVWQQLKNYSDSFNK